VNFDRVPFDVIPDLLFRSLTVCEQRVGNHCRSCLDLRKETFKVSFCQSDFAHYTPNRFLRNLRRLTLHLGESFDHRGNRIRRVRGFSRAAAGKIYENSRYGDRSCGGRVSHRRGIVHHFSILNT
jgi:hypothetical protein